MISKPRIYIRDFKYFNPIGFLPKLVAKFKCKKMAYLNQFILSTILLLTVVSCSKTESNIEANSTITDKWNLVLVTGHRASSVEYEIGDLSWTFNGDELTIVNNKLNFKTVNKYVILDTLGGQFLKVAGELGSIENQLGSIEKLTIDSLIIDYNRFVGCGGNYTFTR